MEQRIINATFYDEAMQNMSDMSLDDFESAIIERLQVLTTIESVIEHSKYTPEWLAELNKRLKKNNLEKHTSYIENKETSLDLRKKDTTSHILLLYAHSKDPILRQWIIKHEVALFTLKCLYIELADYEYFMNIYKLQFNIATDVENDDVSSETDAKFCDCDTYKIPFEQSPTLVSLRSVPLRKGYLYVPTNIMIDVFIDIFKQKLDVRLNHLKAKRFHDQRILDIVDKVRQTQDKLHAAPCGPIDIEDLDRLCDTSFPPCAALMWQTLCDTHHLGHYGRVQLGVFLKGAGLSCAQQLTLWRTHFLKAMDEQTYEKKRYDYYIRYMYGEVGAQISRAPMTCQTIVEAHPVASCANGCPFKHSTRKQLTDNMFYNNFTVAEMQRIFALREAGCVQEACTKFLQYSHELPERGTQPSVVQSPDDYFARSVAYRSADPFT